MHEDMASLIPNPFGSLEGVRILSTGSLVAQPFAAAMAAEMGAEVIQLEQPGPGDALWRTLEFPIQGENGDSVAAGWVQMRRNSFHTTLDLSSPKGREMFLEMMTPEIFQILLVMILSISLTSNPTPLMVVMVETWCLETSYSLTMMGKKYPV